MHTLSPETLHQMTPIALGEILAYLTALWQEDVGTDEAQKRFDPLCERYPHLSLDLLWEEISCAGSLRYTVLLTMPQVGTVSISLAPDTAIPWLLHWARHARENEVVRVNQETLTIEHMIASLDL